MILPLLACLTLVGASSAPLAMSSLPFDYEPAPRCAVYNDSELNIVLDVDEVNTYVFSNTANYLNGDDGGTPTFNISYNSSLFTYEETSPFDWFVTVNGSNDLRIGLTLENSSYFGKFFFYTEDISYGSFEYNLTLVFSSADSYSIIKSLIQSDIEENTPPLGVTVVGEIVGILAAGLTTFGSSIGGSIATVAQSLAFTDGHLSIYFVLVIVFAGVALAIGLTSLLFNWLTNLGK